MKRSEFYEKYWKVIDKDGNAISPPRLNEAEKTFLDSPAFDKAKEIWFHRTRRRSVQIDTAYLKEQMKKLPNFLKP